MTNRSQHAEQLRLLTSRLEELELRVADLSKVCLQLMDKDRTNSWRDLVISPAEISEMSTEVSHLEEESDGTPFVWLLAKGSLTLSLWLTGSLYYKIIFQARRNGHIDVENKNASAGKMFIGDLADSFVEGVSCSRGLEFRFPEFEGFKHFELRFDFPFSFCPAKMDASSLDTRELSIRCFGISVVAKSDPSVVTIADSVRRDGMSVDPATL